MRAIPAKLKFFPVSAFTVVMGITGFALAIGAAERQGLFDLGAGHLLLLLSILLFMLVGLLYAVKALRHPVEVAREFAHPVKLQFFPAISISLILVGTALQTQGITAAGWIWGLGAAMHLLLTLVTLHAWLHRPSIEIVHSNPSWFIPVVGNILVPIGGVHLAPAEISWFFFSIGLVFWLLLFAIILYRLIFHPPLPGKLLPTLAIFLAPPAVGFLAYVALTGGLDGFARVLYYTALFITLLLLLQIPRFLRLGFFLSAWAYSFPLAAMSLASLRMLELTGMPLFRLIATAVLMLLVLVIAALLVRTLVAVQRDEICIED